MWLSVRIYRQGAVKHQSIGENYNDNLAFFAATRQSMMAEDPGGTFFNFSVISPLFSLPQLAIETWQDSQLR